jgi:hypothetical protein
VFQNTFKAAIMTISGSLRLGGQWRSDIVLAMADLDCRSTIVEPYGRIQASVLVAQGH